jgi:succinylglutamate desuccinylase
MKVRATSHFEVLTLTITDHTPLECRVQIDAAPHDPDLRTAIELLKQMVKKRHRRYAPEERAWFIFPAAKPLARWIRHCQEDLRAEVIDRRRGNQGEE